MEEPNLEVFGKALLGCMTEEQVGCFLVFLKIFERVQLFYSRGSWEDPSEPDLLTFFLFRSHDSHEGESGDFYLEVKTNQKIYPVNGVHPEISVQYLEEYLNTLRNSTL